MTPTSIRILTYVLTAGAFFWIGVATQETRKPERPHIVVQPAGLQILGCNRWERIEYERTCAQRWRSARVGK